MISRETIEEVLLRTDIQTLIGGYVALKRAGSNVKGLCPFHSEKTPSFTVYPADNSFYCFGCGVGGDAISFVMKMENVDYPDAVQILAKRAGITVIDDSREKYSNGPKFDKERIYKMNVDAAKFFNAQLFRDNPDSRAALDYFTKERGLSLATVKHFGLGYAPNSYDAFSKYMLSRGYTYEELVVGFLAGKSERGGYYDAFRNRVMFPIIDVSGNVIAFGGRVMDDSKPKYKNSSDTPVFKKLRNLFALNFARHTCQETIILCEGYMDVIALHSAGFTNAVATLGTAITSEQARLMSRYTKRVLICYDADEAGQKAAQRALGMLEEVGLEVRVISIPGAKDPDEYIKKYGRDRFNDVLSAAKSKFEYNLQRILSRYDINIPQQKIDAIKDLAFMISEIYSSAERDVYIREVARRMGISYESLKSVVDSQVRKNAENKKKERDRKMQQEAVGYGDKVNPDYARAPDIAKHEERVLGLMLLFPEHREKVFREDLLCEEDFFTDLGKNIFNFLREACENGDERLVTISERFTPEQMGRIVEMKASRMQLDSNGTDVLLECINNLKAAVSEKRGENNNPMDRLNDLLKKKRGG
ncbi:MAG: DNA primase [Clostridia bacterium]|nr:DNA primase [Clostridia bacterium]